MKNDRLSSMMQAVKKITHDREWDRFHTPKNMAMDLVREASEVLEHFVWETDEEIKQDEIRIQEIAHEMADVLHALLLLSDVLQVDLPQAFWEKLEMVKKRYPVDVIKGISGYRYKNAKRKAKDDW